MKRLKLSAAALAVAGLLGAGAHLVGCGDDDEGDEAATEEAAAPTEVTVTADEYTFELSDTPGPETKKVILDNVGEEPHALVFARINEGFTLEEANELQGRKGSAEIVADEVNAPPGQSKSGGVRGPLEPGNYGMICPFTTRDGETHFELGQQLEFAIE